MNCTLYIYKLWFAKIILSEGTCKGKKKSNQNQNQVKTESKNVF